MKNRKTLLISLGVVLIILIGLFIGTFFNKKEDKKEKNDWPLEINEIYKIVNNINLYNLDNNKEYDYKVLNDENKHMMLFNYLNLKGLLNDDLSIDKMDSASVELFGEKIDYGNLLIAYDKYVYQRDQDKIYRNKLEYAPTYSFAVDVVNYEVKGKDITLDIKISGVSSADGSSSNQYRYKFLKSKDNYKLVSISLISISEVSSVKGETDAEMKNELDNTSDSVSNDNNEDIGNNISESPLE